MFTFDIVIARVIAFSIIQFLPVAENHDFWEKYLQNRPMLGK
jgi:hypothetical protein